MPRREVSEDEQTKGEESLRHSMDELYQWTQVKMVLRLLREEEGIDKDKLAYANTLLNNRFNVLLGEVVPKVEKRKKSFVELIDKDFPETVAKDPLLIQFKKNDYIYHVTIPEIEEKEHSINDLIYSTLNGNRFILTGLISNSDWGIVDSNPVTEVMVPDPAVPEQMKSVAHGVYRIWCFQCKDFFTFEVNAGTEVDKMTCDKCQSVIIEKRKSRLPPPQQIPELPSNPET